MSGPDDAGARTVTLTLRGLFGFVHDRFREQVTGMDHGTLNWRLLPQANSIAAPRGERPPQPGIVPSVVLRLRRPGC